MEIWDIGAQMDADDGRQQAAKDDDVGIPYHLWDQPFWETLELLGRDRVFIKQAQSVVVGPQDTPLLGAFRNWLLRLWRRRVYLSLCRYLKEMTSTERDKSAGRDCLRRVTAADFWEWKEGSRLFFWRWLGRQRDWARDGLPIYQKGTLPSYRVKQGREPVASIRDAVANKLQRFIARDYLSAGTVNSLVSYFSVSKGESDVRLVFDGTKSGLNEVLWAPTFCLPTVDSVTPMLEPGSWQADNDVGEMFYNYMLDPSLRPYCGVDGSPYLSKEPGAKSWLMWNCCVMGLMPSPYGCGRMQGLAEE